MQTSTENVAQSPKFCTLTRNRDRGIERRRLVLHQKFINNRVAENGRQCDCMLNFWTTIRQIDVDLPYWTSKVEHLVACAERLLMIFRQGRSIRRPRFSIRLHKRVDPYVDNSYQVWSWYDHPMPSYSDFVCWHVTWPFDLEQLFCMADQVANLATKL